MYEEIVGLIAVMLNNVLFIMVLRPERKFDKLFEKDFSAPGLMSDPRHPPNPMNIADFPHPTAIAQPYSGINHRKLAKEAKEPRIKK